MSIASVGLELKGWPYAAGESPYKAKGTTFSGHVTWTRDHFPGGLARVDELIGPELAEFFGQRFLASTWYDLYPLCFIGPIMARELGIPYLTLVRNRTNWQAEQDLNGVYRMLLRAISAEHLARIVPGQIQQSFNFGKVVCEVVEKGHVRGEIRNIPWALLPWLSVVVEEYVSCVITRSGGKAAHISVRREGPLPADAADETTAKIDVFFHAR